MGTADHELCRPLSFDGAEVGGARMGGTRLGLADFEPGCSGAILLAALVGIPAYVNTEASLSLVAALVDGGMGTGAALSFLVTGAEASIGSVAGLLVIARRRVVGLVVGILLVAGMLLSWAGEVIL